MLISNDNHDSWLASLEKVTQVLATAQRMHTDWLEYGLDFVDLYVEDVNGDWLESWNEDEEMSQTLLSFLESNDQVAISVRKRLGNQSLTEIADELEACLSITNKDDRHWAVMNILAGGDGAVNVPSSAITSLDEVELLYLAKDLIEKIGIQNPDIP